MEIVGNLLDHTWFYIAGGILLAAAICGVIRVRIRRPRVDGWDGVTGAIVILLSVLALPIAWYVFLTAFVVSGDLVYVAGLLAIFGLVGLPAGVIIVALWLGHFTNNPL